MRIHPYLFFGGRADEAIDFYEKTLGAKLVMRLRFKDNPDGAPPNPAIADNVMHARLQIGNSTAFALRRTWRRRPALSGLFAHAFRR